MKRCGHKLNGQSPKPPARDLRRTHVIGSLIRSHIPDVAEGDINLIRAHPIFDALSIRSNRNPNSLAWRSLYAGIHSLASPPARPWDLDGCPLAVRVGQTSTPPCKNAGITAGISITAPFGISSRMVSWKHWSRSQQRYIQPQRNSGCEQRYMHSFDCSVSG